MSRLKKKLLLYFILIAIVSISVSAEIILEISSNKFRTSISSSFFDEIGKSIPKKQLEEIKKKINYNTMFSSIFKLRNRMIILLMVISGCIISAFYLFIKDIISPMDGIVEASKKIAAGDLTVTVPVLTEDEIGQIAGLINNMNENLQNMIFQIKQEVDRYKEKISIASQKIEDTIEIQTSSDILETRTMKVSEFKSILGISKEVVGLLNIMGNDLSILETFINMYKTYKMGSEISQSEIEDALKNFSQS
jgi:methyl-accepting chemotaxis protein